MFRQILFTQWRWGAGAVVLLGSLGLALPIATVNHLSSNPGLILERVLTWGYVFPVLAVLTGLLLGMSAWAADHRGHHVYALSLPVPRWYYALLRYAAGALLVVVVGAAVWIGALFATSGLDLPTGLHTYAGLIGLRFLLGSLLSYSTVFAMSSGTNRTAGWVLAGLGGLVLAHVIVQAVNNDIQVLELFGQLLVSAGGPLSLFTGPWLLVAV